MRVAVVYQAQQPPQVDGIIKPMKPGGYSDSGADIAYTLREAGESLIFPKVSPDVFKDLDWVFPDTEEGIQIAIENGAECIWLNTVLHSTHPIVSYLSRGIHVIGQNPHNVELYDDKLYTNGLLSAAGLPIPKSKMIDREMFSQSNVALDFPFIAKPIRGRGSQGVVLIKDQSAYQKIVGELLTSNQYGAALYMEEFLPGDELTVTVMPAGVYSIGQQTVPQEKAWCLPAVKRFNHDNGIAPYNGAVAVVRNSKVITREEEKTPQIQLLYQQCSVAAELVGLRAPIRIDCRADQDRNFYLFDLNMKPNMTGSSRPHRRDQDSLTALAARTIGWSFKDLLKNMLRQHWTEEQTLENFL